jgi:hypothetical protein
MIIFDGDKEIILPEQEPGADFMLFSFMPGLSRRAVRPISDSPFTREGDANSHRTGASDEDKSYYQKRAEAEIELARNARDERVMRSHYLLAGYYLDLVHHERLIGET